MDNPQTARRPEKTAPGSAEINPPRRALNPVQLKLPPASFHAPQNNLVLFNSRGGFPRRFFPVMASAKIERTVEKTFSVQSGVKLSVETSGGNVRAEPGDVQSVRIVARQIFPRAYTDAEAGEIAKSLDLVMEQSGNSVRASAKYTGDRNKSPGSTRTWNLWNLYCGILVGGTPVYVEFDVTVPCACDATLETSGGDVKRATPACSPRSPQSQCLRCDKRNQGRLKHLGNRQCHVSHIKQNQDKLDKISSFCFLWKTSWTCKAQDSLFAHAGKNNVSRNNNSPVNSA
jgi:hypothetical protein